MPYDDFKKRTWKVVWSSTSCEAEKIIRFKGPQEEVIVLCGDSPVSDEFGKYLPQDPGKGRDKESIEKEQVYRITFIDKDPRNGKDRIQASFTGVIGGSWTAEDNGGTEYPE